MSTKSRLYHVGLNPDAPAEVLHLAGVEFPKRSERVEGFGAETKRSVVQGAYLELTEEKVAAIKKAATEKVFRFGNEVTKQRKGKEVKHRRAFLIPKSGSGFVNGVPSKPYRKQDGDQDVGRFIFLRPVEHSAIKDETFDPLLMDEAPEARPEKPAKKGSAS